MEVEKCRNSSQRRDLDASLFVLAVWRWQRRTARRLGASVKLHGGAVAFTQYFGSALQMTLHVLVPERLWDAEAHFVALPAPEADEVGGVQRRVLRQLLEDFEETAEEWPEDALEALWTRTSAAALVPSGAWPSSKASACMQTNGCMRTTGTASRGCVAMAAAAARTRKGQVLVFTATSQTRIPGLPLALLGEKGPYLSLNLRPVMWEGTSAHAYRSHCNLHAPDTEARQRAIDDAVGGAGADRRPVP